MAAWSAPAARQLLELLLLIAYADGTGSSRPIPGQQNAQACSACVGAQHTLVSRPAWPGAAAIPGRANAARRISTAEHGSQHRSAQAYQILGLQRDASVDQTGSPIGA